MLLGVEDPALTDGAQHGVALPLEIADRHSDDAVTPVHGHAVPPTTESAGTTGLVAATGPSHGLDTLPAEPHRQRAPTTRPAEVWRNLCDAPPMTTVRLLHGLGADRRAFQRFERLLPDSWDIESFDLLGHGDAPHPASGYRLDDHASYVAELIEQRAPVVLIGHSYGAATSVALAATRPELVDAIVLLDPIARFSVSDVAELDGPGTGTGAMIDAKRDGRLAEQVARMYPDASEALRRWTVETWERMALGVVDELDADWMRFADRVTCPVGIVHGELELGGGGDLAADWFDEPVVTCIEGAGHYLHATHARETATAISETVARLLPA